MNGLLSCSIVVLFSSSGFGQMPHYLYGCPVLSELSEYLHVSVIGRLDTKVSAFELVGLIKCSFHFGQWLVQYGLSGYVGSWLAGFGLSAHS
jgi:hypothetical protein